MPVVGLLLGHSLAHDLGTAAKPIGGAPLGLVGAYAIVGEKDPSKYRKPILKA